MTGPATAGAEIMETEVGEPRPLSLFLIPDSPRSLATGAMRYSFLPKIPFLARNPWGRPVFSLTLILSRQPLPNEESIQPLIQNGFLTFEITFATPPETASELSASNRAEYRPLFIRQATFILETNAGRTHEFQSPSESSAARTAISLPLDRGESLAVLTALDDQPSKIGLRAKLSYRTWREQRVRLAGVWKEVHGFLQNRLDPNGELRLALLKGAFLEMLDPSTGTLTLTPIQSPEGDLFAPKEAGPELFDRFLALASVILMRTTLELEDNDPENRFMLRPAPHPMFRLDYQQSIRLAVDKTIELTASLENVIGGALSGLKPGEFIFPVSPDRGTGRGLTPVPVRTKIPRTGLHSSRGVSGNGASTKISVSGQGLKSAAAVLQPNTAVVAAPAVLLASDLVTMNKGSGGKAAYWAVDNLTLDRTKNPRSLPVVRDPAAAVWPDRVNGRKYWYAPEFEVLYPLPNEDRASSPFLFTFSERGVTSAGQPALEGTIKFTLRRRMSSATEAALRALGNPEAAPVPTNNVSVSLAIPFVDERDNLTKSHWVSASVETSGDVTTASVSLINEWLRLSYGALSQAGFQSEPARLQLAFAYEAYVPVQPSNLELAFVPKEALIPLAYSALTNRDLDKGTYFDAVEGRYHHPGGEILLKRESNGNGAVRSSTIGPIDRAPVLAATISPALSHAAPASSVKPSVISQPQIKPVANLADLVDKTQYATQTLIREGRFDVLFPCSTLGAFYIQRTATGDAAVGCRDALQLGRTSFRQYEEIPALATSSFHVYRSLAQPGRFLIVPARYWISRYPGSDPTRAYRPIVYLYSTVDPAVPANNRLVFQASLQPDIAPYLRRELQAQLAAYARDPVLEYVTEINAQIDYLWTIPSGLQVEVRTVRGVDSFQVAMATDLTGALLVRNILQSSGILGSAVFRLPDSSSLESSFAMDLRGITGPWASGPVDVTLGNGSATLANRIESPVNIGDLVTYLGAGAGSRVPVETSLVGGASHVVPLGNSATEAYPIYSVRSSDPVMLQEIRSFIEDVHINVIFFVQLNFGNHGLSRVEIMARMQGIPNTASVALGGDPPTGEFPVILPLTEFLENRVVQFQVTKVFASGESQTTPWINWDIQTSGVLISITWEMIQ